MMSYKIVDEILEEPFTSLDKLVLIALARHADDAKRIAWPSIETIAWETSLDRRTIQRRLRVLEQEQMIMDVSDYEDEPPSGRKRSTKYGGNGNSTRYRITDKAERDSLMNGYIKRNLKTRRSSKERLPAAVNSVY